MSSGTRQRSQLREETAEQQRQVSLEEVIENTEQYSSAIDAAVEEYTKYEAKGDVDKALRLAVATVRLRKALDPLESVIIKLMNTRLGFRTDRTGKPEKDGKVKPLYEWPVVREAAVECLLQGGRLTGNEFNIIAENCYLTKEFFSRAVREIPGVTEVEEAIGVPIMRGGTALVPYVVRWKKNGVEDSMRFAEGTVNGKVFDGRIVVRVNAGMGEDGAIGKATRKALARVYTKITGNQVADGEVGDEEPAAATVNGTGPVRSSLSPEGNGELADPDALKRVKELLGKLGWGGKRIASDLGTFLDGDGRGIDDLTPEEAAQYVQRLELALEAEKSDGF